MRCAVCNTAFIRGIGGGFAMRFARCLWHFVVFLGLSMGSTAALAAPPPPEIYGNLPGLEMAAMSPSGDHVALIGTVGDKRKLVVLDKANKVVATGDLGDKKLRSMTWAGDDMVLIEASNTAALGLDFVADKAELYGMIVVPLNGEKPWMVFQKERLITGGIEGFYGLTERNGKWYGYFGGATMEYDGKSDPWLKTTAPILYETDLQTRHSTQIADRADGDTYRDWLVGHDGKVAATLQYQSHDGTWSIWNAHDKKLAGGVNTLGKVRLVGLGSTPDTIIYADADSGNWVDRRFEVPLAGGPAKEILKDEYMGEEFFGRRDHQFIGYAIEGDTPAYHFFDSYRDKVMAATLKAFPGVSVNLVDWNDRFDDLIVKTEGPGDPGTWWKVDIKTGSADVLGTSYALNADDVAPMHMIQYKAGDGMDISAVLTLPPGRTPRNLPLIVLPHGGPTHRDYPGFDWWAQAFASRGYTVLQPNFRGSSGYGAQFEMAGHGEWGRKMQTDISDGLAQLVKDGIADPTRVCIMGASYGGYAALAGVTLQHGLYRCAVSVAGIGDLQEMVSTDVTTSGDNDTLRRALKDELGATHDLAAVSPIHFVDHVDVPILLIHGTDDTVVAYDQSRDMASALRHAGKTVEFVTLPGEDHWLSKSAGRQAMLQAAVDFIEKYNPPDPVK